MTNAGWEFLDDEATDGKAPKNGGLSCFCDKEKKDYGYKWYSSFKYKQDYSITNAETGEKLEEPICKKYQETKWKIMTMDNFIKYLIIIVNTVIRMVVIIIIN